MKQWSLRNGARLAWGPGGGNEHPWSANGFAETLWLGTVASRRLFCADDYAAYVELMGQWCRERGLQIWAYCLMPNHVHLIAVPQSDDGLRLAIGEAHRRYTRRIIFREGWRAHLWQGRLASFVMDAPYLLTAAQYIELNPVRAKLIDGPSEYRASEKERRRAGACAPVAGVCGKLAPVAGQRYP